MPPARHFAARACTALVGIGVFVLTASLAVSGCSMCGTADSELSELRRDFETAIFVFDFLIGDMAMRVRFWDYVRDWTRITLEPNQLLSHTTFSRCSEGWTRTTRQWSLRLVEGSSDEWEVVYATYTDACDCDGRLSREEILYCPVDKLNDVEPDWNLTPSEWCPSRLPRWKSRNLYVWDQYAEMAGY